MWTRSLRPYFLYLVFHMSWELHCIFNKISFLNLIVALKSWDVLLKAHWYFICIHDWISKLEKLLKLGQTPKWIMKILFERLEKFQLRLNPIKCLFGVKSGKLLGFIVSNQGISQLMVTCKPISQLLRKKNTKVWNDDY